MIKQVCKVESFGFGEFVKRNFAVNGANNIDFELRFLRNRAEAKFFGALNIVVLAVATDEFAKAAAVAFGLSRTDSGNILKFLDGLRIC